MFYLSKRKKINKAYSGFVQKKKEKMTSQFYVAFSAL